jgi:UDP-glucose 4-epimerase
MRIMLIGGAGFIGKNIAKAFIDNGHSVVIVDRNSTLLKHNSAFTGVSGFYDYDIADVDAMLKLVDQLAIDCVVNLVSTLIPSSSLDALCAELGSSMIPAFKLVQYLAERKIRYVYFSSGGTIYGRNMNAFVSETESRLPINFYGYSKQMFEEYLGLVHRMSALDYLVIRPSNPYGMHQSAIKMQGFISVLLDRILTGETIEIWGDGSVVRDYIWIGDLAKAVVSLLEQEVWNASYNIGSGVGHTLNEVVAIAEAITEKQARIDFKASRSVDVERIVLDISKLKSVVNFNPISLSDGIKLYVEKLVNESVQ